MSTQFRSKGHGRSRKVYPLNRPTAFGPAEHPELEKAVHAETITGARESIADLNRKFGSAHTLDQKEEIRKATQFEANRLNIGAHNGRNSATARQSLAERSKIFDRAAERMGRELKSAKAKPPGQRAR